MVFLHKFKNLLLSIGSKLAALVAAYFLGRKSVNDGIVKKDAKILEKQRDIANRGKPDNVIDLMRDGKL